MRHHAGFIIIPVHNRRAVTLRCLAHLHKQGDLNHFEVVVVDDGSTDGTAEAIQSSYPQIHLLKGDGNLWWTGAIEKGMRYAHERQANYFIWLNDDTLPEPNTIASLINFSKSHHKAIVASQCYDNEAQTFGGQHKTRFSQRPIYANPGDEVQCDALDGNLVCFPASVINEIGFPQGKLLPHYGGDNFYTWQAKENGFSLWLLGTHRSFCRRDYKKERWLFTEDSIWAIWRRMSSPKSPFYWRSHPVFCIRYWGIWGIVPLLNSYTRLVIITIVRVLVPQKAIERLKNHHL